MGDSPPPLSPILSLHQLASGTASVTVSMRVLEYLQELTTKKKKMKV